ncbi:NAD(P)-dependent oxidoreductase [Candidatus Peregrinibacteria bacterium]|nr:NAD(P)-dependent oxidoreductase [Candidatus Peregrinibacteria bacterium]
MKILLLGANGAFGTAVESVCKKRKVDCAGLTHGNIEITNPREIEDAIKKCEPNILINSVALIGNNVCEPDPQRAFNINTVAVYNIANICEARKITLVQLSTHAVFDGLKDDYYTEEDQPRPINIYAASKYAAECIVESICSKYYTIRFPTMFGKRRNKSLGFVDKMLSMIREGKGLRVANDKIDSPSYTNDLAEELIKLLGDKKTYGVYHLANSGRVSYYDFVVKLAGLLNPKIKVEGVEDKEFKTPGKKSLKTALKSVKMSPMRRWEDALVDYVASLNAS